MADDAELAGDDEVGFSGGFGFGCFVVHVHYFDELGGVFFQYAAVFDGFVFAVHFEYDFVAYVVFEEWFEGCTDGADEFGLHLGYVFVL